MASITSTSSSSSTSPAPAVTGYFTKYCQSPDVNLTAGATSIHLSTGTVTHEIQEPYRHCVSKVLCINFKCSRKSPTIDTSMQEIYKTIIANKIQEQMEAKSKTCLVNEDMGHCGNSRGVLTECSCAALNRITNAAPRIAYENKVIEKVNSLISYQNPFNIRIAMFATGGLLGEFVLLTKLVDQLKKLGITGKIHVSLIDQIYKPDIEALHGRLNPNKKLMGQNEAAWDGIFEGQPVWKQFLNDMASMLTSSITLEGSIFGDADDYIWKATHVPDSKHRLLVGQDIGKGSEDMQKINKAAVSNGTPYISLIKVAADHEDQTGEPYLCVGKPTPDSCAPV